MKRLRSHAISVYVAVGITFLLLLTRNPVLIVGASLITMGLFGYFCGFHDGRNYGKRERGRG